MISCLTRTALLSLMTFLLAGVAAAGTVTMTSPSNSQTVSSPFRVSGRASDEQGVQKMQIWVDGVKKAEVVGSQISKDISASSGTRRVTIQAFDNAGNSFKSSVYVTVSGGTGTDTSTDSTTSKTISNIDHLSGWESCSVCAGTGGDGPVASVAHKLGISSPSMDGKSIEFFLGGSTPYSNGLWWKQLGGNESASHFIMDTYYYIKNPNAAQALEFDVNQTRGGKWFIYGTECVMKGTRRWDVYDPYNRKWVPTSIPCEVPKAYTWQHVVLEFKRTETDTQFVSVTVNGQKHYFNKSYKARAASSNTVNVAFQMDGDKYQTDYKVWLDKLKLTMW